jgi:O-antigen/teichoic acid export membrane protein
MADPRSAKRDPAVAGDAAAAARGGASLLVLQTLGRVSALVFIVVLTRQLDRPEVGRYSTVAAIVLFANFLADFGTSPAITRLVSRGPAEADRLLSRTVLTSLLFGCLVALGAVGFGAAAYSSPTVVDVAIASLAIPAAAVLSSVLGALDGAGLIAQRSVVTGLQTLFIALGVVPVLAGADVRAPIVALAAAPWIALVIAGVLAHRHGLWRSRPRFDLGETRRLLRVALPFALSGGVSALVLRFDVIFLSVVRPPAETATYDLALRLLEASAYLGTAVGAPLLFILSRRLGQQDREGAGRAYAEAMRLLYALGLPLSVGLLILARPLVHLALGPEFTSVSTPLAIMGSAQWLSFVIIVQGALVMSGDVVGKGVAVGVVISLVTVGLDLALVPDHGATGAAAAMVVSWVFAAVMLDRFHRRTVGIATPLPSPRLLGATAVMAAVLLGLRGFPLVVSSAAGAVAYGLGLLVTGAVTADDLSRLRRVISARAA